MMFRSLLFVAPLLAAGEVCEVGDACYASDQISMLQTKGRDATKELLDRSKADLGQQTLRTLEANLMGKDGVDTAMCTYYLKTGQPNTTPCEKLDLLQTTFRESLKDFKEFDKIAKNTLTEVMKDVTELGNLKTAQTNFTTGLMAEGVELARLTKAMTEAAGKFGAGSFTEALAALSTQAETSLMETVAEVKEDIKQVLAGQALTLPDGEEFDASTLLASAQSGDHMALKVNIKEAEMMLYKYAMARFTIVMNDIGQYFAQFWKTALHFPSDAADPFEGVEWSEPKDVKKLEKIFWHAARGYLDLVEHVENVCKSEGFEAKKANDFKPRKICKDNAKPKCVDELLYLAAEAGMDGTAACAAWYKTSRRYAKDVAFMANGDICEKAGGARGQGKEMNKACKTIKNAEKKR